MSQHQKLHVVKTRLGRVTTHITDKTQKHSELKNIRSILLLNGFLTRTSFLTFRRPRSQNLQCNHFTSIPSIQGISEKFKRILNEAGVKVTIKPFIPFAEFYLQFDRLIDWNNSKVLKKEAHYSKRLISEAWFINSHPHVMNRSDSDSLP